MTAPLPGILNSRHSSAVNHSGGTPKKENGVTAGGLQHGSGVGCEG